MNVLVGRHGDCLKILLIFDLGYTVVEKIIGASELFNSFDYLRKIKGFALIVLGIKFIEKA